MASSDTKYLNRTTGGILTGSSSLIVFGILLLLNLIAFKHNARVDLTKNKRYSLSEQTLKVLENLEHPLKFYSFYSETDDNFETVKDLLEEYKDASPKISYRFIDPDKDPVTAKKYDVTSYTTTVVEYNGSKRKITFPSEKEFTNAIVKVTHGEEKKHIYFVTMHGEKDIESIEVDGLNTIKTGLSELNYAVSTLNLLKEDTVPDDCAVLVIAGPQKPFEDPEISAVKDYLDAGGNFLLMVDPQQSPKLCQLMENYGIRINDDIILDPKGYQNMLQPVVDSYPQHEITKDFNYGTIFEIARTVDPMTTPPENITVQTIAKTGEESWATHGEPQDLTAEFHPDSDKKGPLSIAVAATTKFEDQDGKLVVFGDSDFANNVLVNSVGNAALAYNTFHWLAEEKDLIAIPPKDPLSQPMQLSAAQLAGAFWIPVVIIPLLILGAGGSKIYYRRKLG